jgi:hypothetical protein
MRDVTFRDVTFRDVLKQISEHEWRRAKKRVAVRVKRGVAEWLARQAAHPLNDTAIAMGGHTWTKKEIQKKVEHREWIRERAALRMTNPKYSKHKRAVLEAYRARPDVREKKNAKAREYYQRPEVKERARKWNARPDVRAAKRRYWRRPDIKKRNRERMREHRKAVQI